MTDWPVKTLGEVCEVLDNLRKPITKRDRTSGGYPYYGATGIVDHVGDYIFDERLVLVGEDGAKWGAGERTAFIAEGKYWVNNHAHVLRCKRGVLVDSWLANFLTMSDLNRYVSGLTVPKLNQGSLVSIEIPVPPLEEQNRIVELLDAATARITELTACYEQARTHANDLLESSLLELFADALESQPKRKMGEVLQIARGGSPRPISEYITKSSNGVNWIKIGDASSSTKYIYETAQKIKPEGVSRSRMVYPGDFLLSNSMSFGRPYIMKTEGCIHDGWLVLRDSKGELDQDFLFYMLGSRFMYERFRQLAAGSTVQNLNSASVSSIEIPVPPIDFQKRIAEKARLLEESVARLNEVNEIRVQHANDLRQSMLEAAFAGDL